ncbi:hypothetical protein [Paenibacillus phocaensis]|uniref:hypothetical protein n=1 Tax=Paenibacillus phocaensis TaxID=1776378 RepID=UPI000839B2A2|nr:hypothetical protein [Paenibacillus phocaensis]
MLSVIINESTIDINNSGTITGQIYFQIEDMYFPELHWSDFVVVILTWWNNSLKTLECATAGTTAEFNFMDGPFFVRCIKNHEKAALSFLRRKKVGEEVISTLETDFRLLQKSIARATKKVIELVDTKQWLTDDIEGLKRFI